jgi:O-antigen/teichoic acid export membrane protein
MSELIEQEPRAMAVAPLRKSLRHRLRDALLSQKRNLQNLSVLFFVNSLIAGIGFVTQVKIANTLGWESFGLLAYGLAIAAYGGAVIRFGLDRALVRDLIHHPAQVGHRSWVEITRSVCISYILCGFLLPGRS